MALNAVIWCEINVQDMARARKFYEAVFAVTLQQVEDDEAEGWMFPWQEGKEGAGGALFKHKQPGMPTGPGGTTVYFACDDCAVEESRVVANGGTVMLSKRSIDPHGFYAIILDTEGNRIGLHSMK